MKAQGGKLCMKKVEYAAGFLVILCVVIGGKIFLGSSDLISDC